VINMKSIKKCIALIVVSVLISLSMVSSHAVTRYFENGYYYSFLNNNAVELVGWDYRTSELPVPSALNGRPVTAIANNAFFGDQNLTGIDFSSASNLGSIGLYSFANCTNISEKLILPENIFFVDICAFEGCSSISEIEINADLHTISAQCFNACSSLNYVKLNSGLEEIMSYAFANCFELTRIDIPESVSYIAESAFANDSNLTLGVYYGSYGYEYAKERSIPYVLLDDVRLGDADGDGYVNISDVTDIQRAVAEMDTLDDLRKKAADINGDGVVTIDDATILQMYLAEFATDYPIGVVTAQ